MSAADGRRPARPVALEARDGRPLAATYHQPPEGVAAAGGSGGWDGAAVDPPRGAVLVAPAIAVRRSFYRDYAAWLAGRGFAVLTLDVRGVGGSRPPDLSEVEGGLLRVARSDLPAALDWLAEHHPGAALQYVAHSLGGQLLGLLPEPGRVRDAVLVAAASAHWRLWSGVDRWMLASLWWIVIPALTRLYGYFPSRLVGLGEDLPPELARSWARWGRHRAYAVDDAGRPLREGYRAFDGRLRAYSFADDHMAPERAVEELLGWYRAAGDGGSGSEVEHRRLAPEDVGRPLGHFGFFREASRGDLWPESARWLAGEGDAAG